MVYPLRRNSQDGIGSGFRHSPWPIYDFQRVAPPTHGGSTEVDYKAWEAKPMWKFLAWLTLWTASFCTQAGVNNRLTMSPFTPSQVIEGKLAEGDADTLAMHVEVGKQFKVRFVDNTGHTVTAYEPGTYAFDPNLKAVPPIVTGRAAVKTETGFQTTAPQSGNYLFVVTGPVGTTYRLQIDIEGATWQDMLARKFGDCGTAAQADRMQRKAISRVAEVRIRATTSNDRHCEMKSESAERIIDSAANYSEKIVETYRRVGRQAPAALHATECFQYRAALESVSVCK